MWSFVWRNHCYCTRDIVGIRGWSLVLLFVLSSLSWKTYAFGGLCFHIVGEGVGAWSAHSEASLGFWKSLLFQFLHWSWTRGVYQLKLRVVLSWTRYSCTIYQWIPWWLWNRVDGCIIVKFNIVVTWSRHPSCSHLWLYFTFLSWESASFCFPKNACQPYIILHYYDSTLFGAGVKPFVV